MLGKINVGIIISLPEPSRAIVVDPYTHGANVFVFIGITRLIESIESDAIVIVQTMSPQNVGVLRVSMQTNIKDAIAAKLVIAGNLACKPELHRFVGMKSKIVEGPQVGPRITKNTIVLCAKFGID